MWPGFGNLKLSPGALLITLLPLAAAVVSSTIAVWYGLPDRAGPLPATPDIHLEAAGRWRMLATWYVLASLGAGCILYFLVRLMRFERDSFFWLLGAYLLFVALGCASLELNQGKARAENGLGADTICTALRAGTPVPQNETTRPAQPKQDTRNLPPGHPDRVCPGNEKYAWMWLLNDFQRYLLVLVMPALGLGAVSALATGGVARQQAGQLKTFLYLSAALLVGGLLFLSALLRWPGAAFRGDAATAYESHVDAYLLYWGASYSVLIAAYYVPVAARLSATMGATMAVAAREAKDDEEEDLLGVIDILKVAAAVFAPVIAALIGNVAEI